MFFHPKNLKSENNDPWLKPWFNILLHTQSIVCATVDSQCFKYLGYITLTLPKILWDCKQALAFKKCCCASKAHVYYCMTTSTTSNYNNL